MPSNSPAPASSAPAPKAPALKAPALKAPALKAPAPASGLAGSFKVTGGPRGSVIDMRGRSAAPAPMQKLSSAFKFGVKLAGELEDAWERRQEAKDNAMIAKAEKVRAAAGASPGQAVSGTLSRNQVTSATTEPTTPITPIARKPSMFPRPSMSPLTASAPKPAMPKQPVAPKPMLPKQPAAPTATQPTTVKRVSRTTF